MTKEDQEWFDAIAGKSNPNSMTASQQEAVSVRRALLSRRESIEKETLDFDLKQLDLIKQNLEVAGLIKNQRTPEKSFVINFVLGLVSIKSGQAVVQKVGIVAAILFLGLAIRSNYLETQPNEPLIYRGDGEETYIIDERPQARLENLTDGLTAIKAEYVIEKLSFGRTLVKVKATEDVTTFLLKKEIQPKLVDGYISIVISPPKVDKKS